MIRRFFPGIALAVLVLLLVCVPVSHASTYKELNDRLEAGQSVPQKFVDKLPPPSTARQYWLRSRVRSTRADVLSDLRAAVRQSRSPEDTRTYLLDWVEVALLEPGSGLDLSFLHESLQNLGTTDSDGRLWLLAGRLAQRRDHMEWAREWLRTAAEHDSVRGRAWLALARLHLAERDPEEAREYLEKFLIHYPSSSRPEFWLLKGRMFEQTGSDSDAYVAYSHIVNQYPNSPLLSEAEQRLEKLSLPRALYPDSSNPSRGSSESSGSNSPDRIAPEEGPRADRYRIQIGSFLDRQRALSFRSKVQDRFERELVVQPTRVKGRRYHRVQVVGFSDREQASRRLRELKQQGMNGFVVRGEGP